METIVPASPTASDLPTVSSMTSIADICPDESNPKSALASTPQKSNGSLDFICGVIAIVLVIEAFSKTRDTISEKAVEAEAKSVTSSSPSFSFSNPKSKSSTDKTEDLTSDAVKRIPSHLSPLFTSFRIGEWAKHLSHADTPEPESLDELVIENDCSISPENVEVAAPLNIEELQQTALTGLPPPAIERLPSLPEDVQRDNFHRSSSKLSRQSASPLHGIKARHSLGQLRAEDSSYLMAYQEKMNRARVSSESLIHDSWTRQNRSRLSIEEMHQSRPGSPYSTVKDDDVSIAQRRNSSQHQHRATCPYIDPNAEISRRSPIDRRQTSTRLPREPSKPKKNISMTDWHKSLQEDFSKQRPLLAADIAQNELMGLQRQAQMARHQRRVASENLHNSIAERMRHQDMQGLHREAMRRMQASATRNAMNSP